MSQTSVLWVTQEAAADPRTGGSLRSLRLIQALAAVANVSVLSLNPLDEAAFAAVSGAGSVRTLLPERRGRVAAKARGWLRLEPAVFAELVLADARAVVDEAVSAGSVVVLEHLRLMACRPRRGQYVMALQNVDSDLIGQVPAGAPVWRQGTAAADRALARRAELSLRRDPRALVTVVSEQDRERLGIPALVVPNGADLPAAVPAVPVRGSTLFLGSLSYAPNVGAVRWWAERVASEAPDVPLLTVAGRGGAAALGGLADHPSLEVIGEVDDIGPLMAGSSVFVIPVQEGSGSRLKLLEAMAWGRPVVTTTKGAEGIPVEHGAHVLVADTPAEFAAAVQKLHADPALAARLASGARDLAARYSWHDIGPPFAEAVLRHAVGARS